MGADGFVPKEADSEELLTAVSTVLAGKQYLSPRVHRVDQAVGLKATHVWLSVLTQRQEQIVLLLGEGKSAGEICKSLDIGPSTMTFHRHRIMHKLGVESVAALTQCAVLVRAGLAVSL